MIGDSLFEREWKMLDSRKRGLLLRLVGLSPSLGVCDWDGLHPDIRAMLMPRLIVGRRRRMKRAIQVLLYPVNGVKP